MQLDAKERLALRKFINSTNELLSRQRHTPDGTAFLNERSTTQLGLSTVKWACRVVRPMKANNK